MLRLYCSAKLTPISYLEGYLGLGLGVKIGLAGDGTDTTISSRRK